MVWHGTTRMSPCAQVGDLIVVDGGMVSLEVTSKAGPDVVAKCVDPGIILSRANLTFQRDGQIVRARNAMLPVLSSKLPLGPSPPARRVSVD